MLNHGRLLRNASVLGAALALSLSPEVRAELPTGYLVWSKGNVQDPASRKLYRLTLPGKTDLQALTSGEDVESQISPDGAWVAYAKAKLAGGSDYHNPKLWKIYLVSIHGAAHGRQEIKIDDDGVWPSWGGRDVLYYNQPDGTHTKVVRVLLDADGRVKQRSTVLSTAALFPSMQEITECHMARDGSWFAARTRGPGTVNGVGAYQVSPPKYLMLAKAGSIGCMPYVAPSGKWGLIAGAEAGIRWGHGPGVAGRLEDQQLIPALPDHRAYHPGISTDEKWVLAGQGTDQDHNSGPYDLYLYALDAETMSASGQQQLVSGGFNGWPHLWVGQPGPPPPPRPRVLDFYPESYTLVSGESTAIRWSTNEADLVELDGKAVETSGRSEVKPTATATYRLTARNSASGQTEMAEATVTVNASAQPVRIVGLKVTPESIEQGQSAVVSWEVQNATTLDLDGARVAPHGQVEVSPTAAATYVLTAQGHLGPVSAKAQLAVRELRSDLLPDKGGFLCRLGASSSEPLWTLLLLAVGLVLLHLRGRARRLQRSRRAPD